MIPLQSEYQVLESIGNVLNVVALLMIVGGEFARHAAPRFKDVARAAEAIGWISFAALSIVATQQAAERRVACSVFRQDCPNSLWSELWRFLGPYVVDAARGGAAAAFGWTAAKVWLAMRDTSPKAPS